MSNSRWFRSPYAMSTHDSALLVVDVQEKLIGLLPGHQKIVWNIGRLIDAARILEVPVAGSEQYPQGLGPTIAELADRIGDVPSKVSFSCIACEELLDQLDGQGVSKLLVAGIETHVCVQQTVLDLLASGLAVFVAADATGSRYPVDYDVALRRMESAGATITTTEAAMFEWCQVAGTPQFKQISQLIRQPGPDAA
ncbi:MAG: hydrolase [Planctomycetota bacterium]|nr:hydrolase [Planctomycetota bacterium]